MGFLLTYLYKEKLSILDVEEEFNSLKRDSEMIQLSFSEVLEIQQSFILQLKEVQWHKAFTKLD